MKAERTIKVWKSWNKWETLEFVILRRIQNSAWHRVDGKAYKDMIPICRWLIEELYHSEIVLEDLRILYAKLVFSKNKLK